MLIAIIYHQKPRQQRLAIQQHLLSFKEFSSHSVCYWNIAYGIPSWFEECNFDIMLFHFTFFLPNINTPFTNKFKEWSVLKNATSFKAAMVQDEYVNTTSICDFFKEFNIQKVYTCLPEELWELVYPYQSSGVTSFTQVLTGYIDEKALPLYNNNWKPHAERKFDIIYRARKMPFYLGSIGAYKSILTEKFKQIQEKYSFRMDVSNDPNDFIFGNNWIKYICDARIMPGCEGGSNIFDPIGDIRTCMEKQLLEKPDTSYEEFESHCLPDKAREFNYTVISPRHFEACMGKTCQVLIEGTYNGILKPDIHYISIRKDWSNFEEVCKKILDIPYCEQMAIRAYTDIVESDQYTYRRFVSEIFKELSDMISLKTQTTATIQAQKRLVYFQNKPFLFNPRLVIKSYSIEYLKRIVWFFRLDKMKWFRMIEQKVFGSISTR
ncbi:MAG: hypothetical protein M3Q56_03055 [Bacteroidota bacterium]|nr:hypothetical protein [Bacteroidota bacterium]